jgi:L-fucose mutarotase/ribose pyranase (RbsD/FucU family)
MTDTKSDNLTGDLLRIHAAITRGIEIVLESKGREGASLYEDSLYATIITHHKTEDETTFPLFRAVLPDVPIDKLIADHVKMTELVKQKDIVNLKELWTQHIKKEESYFTQELLDHIMDPEEQMKHRIEIGKTAGKYSVPPYLVVPFALYNLTKEERNIFEHQLPPEVLNNVKTEWQEKWQPMKSLFYGF